MVFGGIAKLAEWLAYGRESTQCAVVTASCFRVAHLTFPSRFVVPRWHEREKSVNVPLESN